MRSAEGLSPHREISPRSDWRLCRNKGLHPLRRFAAIPAHPQKQYTRRWRLYHFCGFYYPIREVIPIAIYHYCPTLIVAPITSKAGKKPSQPTHYYAERIHGLELPGMVLLEQIKTIDKRRVRKYLGRMTRQQMEEIGEAIEEALGLYVPEEMEAP